MNKVFLFFIFFTILLSSPLFINAQELSTKNKKAIQLFNKANESKAARDFDSAKDFLYQAIEKDKNFVEAYVALGTIHKLYQDNVKARKCFEKIVERTLNPMPFFIIPSESFICRKEIMSRQRNYSI